jgi:hypothetical protein
LKCSCTHRIIAKPSLNWSSGIGVTRILSLWRWSKQLEKCLSYQWFAIYRKLLYMNLAINHAQFLCPQTAQHQSTRNSTSLFVLWMSELQLTITGFFYQFYLK